MGQMVALDVLPRKGLVLQFCCRGTKLCDYCFLVLWIVRYRLLCDVMPPTNDFLCYQTMLSEADFPLTAPLCVCVHLKHCVIPEESEAWRQEVESQRREDSTGLWPAAAVSFILKSIIQKEQKQTKEPSNLSIRFLDLTSRVGKNAKRCHFCIWESSLS
jgi:hypothetical protein